MTIYKYVDVGMMKILFSKKEEKPNREGHITPRDILPQMKKSHKTQTNN